MSSSGSPPPPPRGGARESGAVTVSASVESLAALLNSSREGAKPQASTNQTGLKQPTGGRYTRDADVIAMELREARLEEELDKAHTVIDTLQKTLRSKESEVSKLKQAVAHHRQKAVEARLQVQELRGSSS